MNYELDTTTYAYDPAGELAAIAYDDGTGGVTNGYDRRGRQTSVTNGAIITTRTYNDAGELLTESYSGGPLNGLSVTNGYDQFLRRTNVSILNSPSTILASTAYAYDAASRLQTMTSGTNSATYTYLANSPLVDNIAFKNNGTMRMTTTKTYDYLNRLTAISSVPSASSAVSFNYAYNNANQRTSVTNAESARWVYQYDSLGQVTGGNRYWSDGTPVAGQQFDYTFDDIGNRKTTASGGDTSGANLRTANYTNNLLNQITSRDVPGYVDVKGVSFATNTVTVNGQTAYRKVEYFRKELSVGNTSVALWTNIIIAATGQTSVTGKVFVAKSPENFQYDPDGNQTNDGRWTMTWDGENRLITMTSLTNAPGGSKLKLDFAYDSKSRRIQKIVSTNDGSAYVAQSTNKFVYDGWNLLAVLASDLSPLTSYTWGLDLSGSLQGAGGVGGLLGVSYHGSATTNCFAAYDGNGNVAALVHPMRCGGLSHGVNANDGTLTANYEYGPFGEVIRMTGLMAFANPFRFSTKYQDNETDLLYYGYRFYNSSSGRWLNRDPIGERGGVNLYGFVHNDPLEFIDGIGLSDRTNPSGNCCGPRWNPGKGGGPVHPHNFVPTNVRSLHIGFDAGDWVTGGADLWGWLSSDISVTVKNGEDLLDLKAKIERRLGPYDCIGSISMTGHGNSADIGGGQRNDSINLASLRIQDSHQRQLLEFLRGHMCKHTLCNVDMKSCALAKEDAGKEMLLELSTLLGANVTGFDGDYAVIGWGNQYTACPDGKIFQSGSRMPYPLHNFDSKKTSKKNSLDEIDGLPAIPSSPSY